MAEQTHAQAHSHGHTSYVRIWALLVVLLVVSVIGPELNIRIVTLITAFGVAIVKAYLVARHFMHLSIEPRWVGYILAVMITFMVLMVGGVGPDVMKHDGQNWQKLYEEPTQGAGSHESH